MPWALRPTWGLVCSLLPPSPSEREPPVRWRAASYPFRHPPRLHACESSLLIGSRDKVAGNLTTGGTLRATLLGLVLQRRCGPCPRGLWSLLGHSPCEALTCTVHRARLSCVAASSSGGAAPHASSRRALCPCGAPGCWPRAALLQCRVSRETLHKTGVLVPLQPPPARPALPGEVV